MKNSSIQKNNNTVKSFIVSALKTATSSNIAITDEKNKAINFNELNNKIYSIVTFLELNFNDTSGCYILYTNKSVDSYSCLLAILLTNKSVVPVDVKSPIERLLKISNDCSPQGIFIEKENIKEFSSKFKNYTLLEIPNSNISIIKFNDVSNIQIKDLAYILYTSGSTGIPKGVKLSNKNILSFINWAVNYFPVSKNDIFCSVAPFHFDLSIFDIFVSLFYGAKLVLFNDETIRNPRFMNQLLEEHRVSVIYSTPTLFSLLIKYGKTERFDHSALKVVNYAGEVFVKEYLIQLKKHWNSAQFFNLYGPTETNVCTVLPIPNEINETFSVKNIGLPCQHCSCKILVKNKSIHKLSKGLKGELIVTGDVVFEGYLGLEKSSSFIEDVNHEKWYKTGDIVKVISNNQLEFLYRKDRLIKKNGYRIELGEIENVLIKNKNISRIGVIMKKSGEKKLIHAFCETKSKFTINDAIEFSKKHLPDYMIPDKFILLNKLAINSNGKLDYQKMLKI